MIEKITDIDWSFHTASSDKFSLIHPYPAKFISQIPDTLIGLLKPNRDQMILDPFCGSGTTLQSARALGYSSIGVDLNPVACLISRVRTSALHPGFYSTCEDIIKDCIRYTGKLCVPDIPNIDHWFSEEIQQALANLRRAIDSHADNVMYDALRFCFSSIIIKVSNQDSDTRYAFRDKGKTTSDVYGFFLTAAKKLQAAKSSETMPDETTCTVINRNSLKLTARDIPDNIGLVITSPPYPNAYEYWLYHKFRMHWLGFDPAEVKSDEIGTRSQYFKKPVYEGYDFVPQMEQLMRFLYTRCVDGAYLCFVIGRSKIHGHIYNNDEIIQDIASRTGFSNETKIEREISCRRKSFNLANSRIKEEYIVIFRK